MEVNSLFAVPVARCQKEKPTELNDALYSYFKSIQEQGDKYRNVIGTPTIQRNIFESEMNLFSHKNEAVQELRQYMLGSIYQFIKNIKRSDDRSDYRQIMNHTWFHITRDRGYIGPHNHPMAAWSAVYYVRTGNPDPRYNDSGAIRFFNPNQALSMYRDPSNSNLVQPYSSGLRTLQPKEGELVIFPSYLSHEVAPYYGDSERVCVATNCWVQN
ncbi:hypothetical protein G3R49_14660 [Shewanella sp. WXL01]|uniref:Fe2OG dioxygenase domain-containing protein n=1 Tax=Shewanella maritima TaxID=2520507 RepID=A0A411PKU6_9GAMM|nr:MULTISPECIES: TIGR02466 family protein [Shewanella]NKF51803.1 hypothetical protein [Shewanella sp. WXL01]QBF84138.1 hypothetical protein EXU30_16780 [Shewanella maritima]